MISKVTVEAEGVLAPLASLPGVSFVALMDREGFVIDWAGWIPRDPEVVAALASCLLQSSEGIGRELGQGALQSMVCEFDEGLVLVMGANSPSRLAVMLRDPAALEAARRLARQVLPALLGAP